MAADRPKNSKYARLLPRTGAFEITRIGTPKAFLGDPYASLLASSWLVLVSCIASVYFLANIFFACLYLALRNGIDNARPGSFQDALFFSVQTMATIGYGRMVPVGIGANILVALEALFGFGFFAVVTGMAFAKLSRPSARVLFSDAAVIGPYDGKPHLMLRMANERGNRIVDPVIQLVILIEETSQEGQRMRRFYDLPLVRDRVPFMQYTWTVMHLIDEKSHLFGLTPERLRDKQAEIIISLTGTDETFAQQIHARHSYVSDEILCNAVFEDVLSREDGRIVINFKKFNETRPAHIVTGAEDKGRQKINLLICPISCPDGMRANRFSQCSQSFGTLRVVKPMAF